MYSCPPKGRWIADPNSPFLSLWAKWDSQWYIQIVREGYWFQPLQQSNVAFFPLYPLATPLMMPWQVEAKSWAGFLVSNLAFLVTLIFLYKLAEMELGQRDGGRRTVAYLAFFPTAFFFSCVYTESLFLLLSIACIYWARRRWWLAAAAAGMLAAATRNLGVVLWALATWEWLAARAGSSIGRIAARCGGRCGRSQGALARGAASGHDSVGPSSVHGLSEAKL